ncbi:tyrosinase family protein [Streptomyces sp. TP-A0874]|uniref:tyrosinase family protein n=1 Tax=Streptomyces sp. TP-A0874 TaxID=549819 RepID=UPI0008533671|nr:tyrosinase family protein [Streptomyces sp. TP-A0874]
MAQLVRRDQSVLSVAEKQAYVNAVLKLKSSPWATYDDFVRWHEEMARSTTGHRGPGFLPWHREFVLRFEQQLGLIAPGLSVPYWDWTKDNSSTSSIWRSDFMGGNGRKEDWKVEDGAFAFDNGWTCVIFPDAPEEYLTRNFGGDSPTLPSAAAVKQCLAATVYDVAPWDETSTSGFRNMLEGWIPPGVHNMVHQWVGGALQPPSSPNDPVFFLHHCNLDRLWAQWQRQHPGTPYVPTSGAPKGNNLPDVLPPWDQRTIADVLDHTALGYQYDTEYPLPEGNQMLPGDTLLGGNEVWSQGSNYFLTYQTDGNLVLYDSNHKPVWNTATWRNHDPGRCTMNFDGTLAVYGKGNGQPQWSRPTTAARPGYRLTVWDQGYISIHHPDRPDQPVWTSKDP